MKQWFRIELPARWTQNSPGCKSSNMNNVYIPYFGKHNIIWEHAPYQMDSDCLAYNVMANSEEDLTALKLKMI